VQDNVLSTIGDTPLVHLGKLFPAPGPQVFAKLEAFNPGGSIKDRPALQILEESLRSGSINQSSVIRGCAEYVRAQGLRSLTSAST
jgi:N-(2-amino-2-carboxyethyl)-L-glutamate synthase